MSAQSSFIGVRHIRSALQTDQIQHLCEKIATDTPLLRRTKAMQAESAEKIWAVLSSLSAADVERSSFESMPSTEYMLNYGRKRLSLTHEEVDHSFLTVVDCDRRRRAQSMETTLTYAASRVLMQIIADRVRQDMEYCFVTDHPKLKRWSAIHGRHIFAWEESMTGDSSSVLRQTTIRPS